MDERETNHLATKGNNLRRIICKTSWYITLSTLVLYNSYFFFLIWIGVRPFLTFSVHQPFQRKNEYSTSVCYCLFMYNEQCSFCKDQHIHTWQNVLLTRQLTQNGDAFTINCNQRCCPVNVLFKERIRIACTGFSLKHIKESK